MIIKTRTSINPIDQDIVMSDSRIASQRLLQILESQANVMQVLQGQHILIASRKSSMIQFGRPS
jgi:hypothetical protein